MLAHAVAGAFDLDDDGVVQQPVEQRGGDDGIAEDLAPFGEAAVRGEDHSAALVAGVDELEEQVAAAGDDGQVSDLVDDQESEAAEEADLLAQGSFALRLCQGADQVGQSGEVDAFGRPDRLDAEGDRQMALAGAGRPEEVEGLAAVDELQLGECHADLGDRARGSYDRRTPCDSRTASLP